MKDKCKKSYKLFSQHMAMDLGTANTIIYMKGRGIVLNEPTVVAYNIKKDEVMAVGEEAKSFLGRTPLNIKAVRPLKNGVIEDFIMTKTMIREFIYKVQKLSMFFKPKMVICVPGGVTQVEKKAVIEAAEEVGAGKVYLLEEPVAAAIGAGLDLNLSKGQMIIDIGGGTTEVAVFSNAYIDTRETTKVAGDEFNKALIKYLLKMHSFQIGENTAEQCKIKAGSACFIKGIDDYVLHGKDVIKNCPVELRLSPEEIRVALMEPLKLVISSIKKVIKKTHHGLLIDIKREGIHLAGGGSLLSGFDQHIEEETGIRCNYTADPLTTVIRGSGMALEEIRKYKKMFIN